MNENIIPLHQLYILALAEVIKSEKYEAALQDLGEEKGQIYLLLPNSTGAQFKIVYQFGLESVNLGAVSKDGKTLAMTVTYFDGLDAFMPKLLDFIRAGRIGHKKAA